MSVSDWHGGGLTLQRVIGAELDRVGTFVHVSRFGTDYPASERFAPRCLNMPMWSETNASRKMIGRTGAAWLSGRPALIQMHARRIASAICVRNSRTETFLHGLVCPQTAISLYAVEALAKRRSVKYVTWIMDDQWVQWRSGKWVYPEQIEKLFASHLKHAEFVFVISPVMGQFYRDRFGVDSEVLFSPADPCADPQWGIRRDSDQVRLGYFGSLGSWQRDALYLLAESLESANADLDIYTGENSLPRPLQRPRVRVRGRIDPMEIQDAMRGYDAVVLPASFEPVIRNMSEFNIATKMSECLASGTVTLFIGPRYAAMGRLLEDYGAGLVVTDKAVSSVVNSIARLRDHGYRRAVLESARKLVRSRMSTAAMHEVWLKGLARLG